MLVSKFETEVYFLLFKIVYKQYKYIIIILLTKRLCVNYCFILKHKYHYKFVVYFRKIIKILLLVMSKNICNI